MPANVQRRVAGPGGTVGVEGEGGPLGLLVEGDAGRDQSVRRPARASPRRWSARPRCSTIRRTGSCTVSSISTEPVKVAAAEVGGEGQAVGWGSTVRAAGRPGRSAAVVVGGRHRREATVRPAVPTTLAWPGTRARLPSRRDRSRPRRKRRTARPRRRGHRFAPGRRAGRGQPRRSSPPPGWSEGSMALVDLARAEPIYAAMGSTVEASGGSAANTVAGVAALGGTAGFVGKVADDALGRVFVHDIRAAGVEFDAGGRPATPASATGRWAPAAAWCWSPGTPSGPWPPTWGRPPPSGPTTCRTDLVARGRIVYLEGYLWDLPPAKEAMRRAIGVAHAPRRLGGPLPLRPVLRGAAPARVPRPPARRRRRALRQRGGDHSAVRCDVASTRRSRRRRRPACWWPSPGAARARWW